MSNEQIITDHNPAGLPPLAPAKDADFGPVDLSVLSSFQELQDDGQTGLVMELIELYLQDATVKIEAVREALAQADGEALKCVAHSLKGSSGTLGVRQIASLCEELESLVDAGLTHRTFAVLPRLEAELVRVREVLTLELQLRSHEVSLIAG
ncbi:MAG TPA: Hpt domain-containing protein [Pyrinomonadaceae bacterium]|nr:Hpt domain-containing protein [Pyrinomonadaceae bacterium]